MLRKGMRFQDWELGQLSIRNLRALAFVWWRARVFPVGVLSTIGWLSLKSVVLGSPHASLLCGKGCCQVCGTRDLRPCGTVSAGCCWPLVRAKATAAASPLEDGCLCQVATGSHEPSKVSERQWTRFLGLKQMSKK